MHTKNLAISDSSTNFTSIQNAQSNKNGHMVGVTAVAAVATPTSAGGESWGLAPLHPVQRPVRVSVVA